MIAYHAYFLGLNPNVLTVVSFSTSILGISLIFLLHPTTLNGAISIVFLLLLGYAIDSADGRLARLSGLAGPHGEWLDHVLDAAKVAAVHGACIFLFTQSSFARSAPLFMAHVAILSTASTSFFAPILRDKLDPSGGEERTFSFASRLILLPFDYGFFCFIFLLAPWPDEFMYAYLTWGGLFFVRTLAGLAKSERRLSRLT